MLFFKQIRREELIMAFGDILKQLLETSGIKQIQLAEHLGYDVSYINKWISGQKHPSLKNNRELFKSIAEFIVKYGGEELHSQLLQEGITEEQEEYIVGLLSEAYRQPEPQKNRSYESTAGNNSMFHHLSTQFTVNTKSMSTAIQRRFEQENIKTLEFVSIPLLCYCGKDHARSTWLDMYTYLPENKKIHIRFAADFGKKEYRLELCHDVMLFLYGLPERISFDIFPDDQFHEMNQGLYLCQDAIFSMSSYDVLRQDISVVLSEDKSVVSSYYSMADNYLYNKPRLVQREEFQNLYRKKYFQSFMFSTAFFSLHTVMPMIFMTEEMLERLCDEHNFDLNKSEIYQVYKKTLPKWNFVLYKSAVMKFLFDGNLWMWGKTINLSPEERKQYLAQLLEYFAHQGGSVQILSDTNPLMRYGDISASIFSNGTSLFSVRHHDDVERKLIHMNDEKLMGCFNAFFEKLQTFPANLLMKKEEAIAFLQHCMELM